MNELSRAGALAVLMVLPAGSTQAQIITEFGSGITPGAGAYQIKAGRDGNLWFTEYQQESAQYELGPIDGASTQSKRRSTVIGSMTRSYCGER